MSHTLVITERSKSELNLKNPLAQKLVDRFGGSIDQDGLDYLRGLQDGITDADDCRVISEMIERIEDGSTFDLRSEY